MTAQEKKAFQEYIDARTKVISKKTSDVPINEPSAVKEARKERLRGDFIQFCQYYLPHYCTAPFGWFHKQAAKRIIADKNIFAVLEWPREHSKSVFADVLIPLFLKANEELDGMIVVSSNQNKAIGLLIDLQLELQHNERYIYDYGEQYSFGDWAEGEFSTRDGAGFWALGRGQSPRGLRNAEKRPNLGVVDDLDDDELVENEDRVEKTVNWVEGALFPCFSILGARFIVAGNRIHRKSVLAHLVGDVEEGDPVKPAIYHCKVYALENPKTHQMDQSEAGVPAWKERYTRKMLEEKWSKIRYAMVQREFFHIFIVSGKVIKSEWMTYIKTPPLAHYPFIVTYNDPSWKDTKKNDYKAIVALGPLGKYRDLLDCWVAQATKTAMAKAHYDMHEWLLSEGASIIYHFIEGGLMQDSHIEEYQTEGQNRGYMLPIQVDKRQKPDKAGRIEANLQPLFELGCFRISQRLKGNKHFVNWKDQLLSFPTGHDDAPDATEGGIYIINQKVRTVTPATSGGNRRTTKY
ncbi:hypothetical protein [Spirosoma aerolatum]|uniref:hypothetical protein n=1 Tax=Spirosoma aerolatum TaxID=1211326 RepID=UPI0009AD1E42|nr:hypothetical protein [Spirosoma aerolatum]